MHSDVDFDLLLRWRAGDERAGAQLFQRNASLLRGFLKKRTPCDVEDLIQQTFLACFDGASHFREESSFRSYLIGIARHQSQAYRRRARRAEAIASLLTEDAHATLPCADLATRRAHRELTRALAAMPSALRYVLELSYWHELPQNQIACALNVPLGTVASRLRRAKERLRRHLTEPARVDEF
jgi:RNA polymerase sigma-70 factor (ECF subfamily)